jgi:hypothetical protein
MACLLLESRLEDDLVEGGAAHAVYSTALALGVRSEAIDLAI